MKVMNNTEKTQAVFLLKGVGVFLKNSNLDQMTVQNGYGAISVSRTTLTKGTTHSIGFATNGNDDMDDDESEFDEKEFRKDMNENDSDFNEKEYNEFINDFVRWF